MSLQGLVFDSIALKEILVTFKGDDKTPEKKYILSEANEEAVVKYKDARMAAAKIDASGDGTDIRVVGFNAFNDIEPLLVSLCLYEDYEYKGESRRKLVPLATILKWKPKIVRSLYDWIIENSDIEEEATATLEKQAEMIQEKIKKAKAIEESAKKEPNATLDTST